MRVYKGATGCIRLPAEREQLHGSQISVMIITWQYTNIRVISCKVTYFVRVIRVIEVDMTFRCVRL